MHCMEIERCRFGYEEYDGSRYCFEHAGFLEAGLRTHLCDRHPRRHPAAPPVGEPLDTCST